MVDYRTASKPSRSDEVLDPEEQTRITDRVRTEFNSMGPKRPTKPNRSEPESATSQPALSDQNVSLPEFEKFQALRAQSEVIFSGADSAEEEFVETEYYKQLDSIDKQHHTTGTGFIKVAKDEYGDENKIQLLNGHENGGKIEMIFKTNPATNDWIPKLDNANQVMIMSLSAKPKRSESDY